MKEERKEGEKVRKRRVVGEKGPNLALVMPPVVVLLEIFVENWIIWLTRNLEHPFSLPCLPFLSSALPRLFLLPFYTSLRA